MNPKDTYVKLVDLSGKHSDVITYHRTWDEDLFLAKLSAQHAGAEKDEDKRLVKKATQAEYRKAAGYKPQHCN